MENTLKEKIQNFVNKLKVEKPIVFITSGGTSVPLEKNTVRILENFSTGTRGARSAEFFLKSGFPVIFFHRQGSVCPFSIDM
jgi:phosphopantothenate---cysteine ligase (ATP)